MAGSRTDYQPPSRKGFISGQGITLVVERDNRLVQCAADMDYAGLDRQHQMRGLDCSRHVHKTSGMKGHGSRQFPAEQMHLFPILWRSVDQDGLVRQTA